MIKYYCDNCKKECTNLSITIRFSYGSVLDEGEKEFCYEACAIQYLQKLLGDRK